MAIFGTVVEIKAKSMREMAEQYIHGGVEVGVHPNQED